MRSATLVAWLTLALLGACDKPQPATEIRPVRTVTAVAGSDGELVSLTGHIRAQKEQSLAFDGRMIKRHVEVGQVVRPNDLIAELDPVPQRDALHQAQAKLAAAEATLREASNNMERKRTLTGQGWSTKADYDAAERAFETAKAQLNVAKGAITRGRGPFQLQRASGGRAGCRHLQERGGGRGGKGGPDDRHDRARWRHGRGV